MLHRQFLSEISMLLCRPCFMVGLRSFQSKNGDKQWRIFMWADICTYLAHLFNEKQSKIYSPKPIWPPSQEFRPNFATRDKHQFQVSRQTLPETSSLPCGQIARQRGPGTRQSLCREHLHGNARTAKYASAKDVCRDLSVKQHGKEICRVPLFCREPLFPRPWSTLTPGSLPCALPFPCGNRCREFA